MKKYRIAIIGTVGLPAKYGGFETLAEHLITHLGTQYDFTVYCSQKKYTKTERISTYKGAQLKYLPLEANGIQSIPYDALSILHSLKNNDVLLILGVAGAFMIPFIRWFTNKKIIISIDGIEWKRDKWSPIAKIYLWLAERIAVRFSHIDISDNESIQDYTAMRYQTLSRVIEYGADHTSKVTPNEQDYIKYPFLKEKYAVKVCRIEPENNVHMVLEAFRKNEKMKLVLVGNWNNSDYGRNLKTIYSNYPNIILFDPIYNQREIDLIRSNSNLYIHAHSAGGTNPSLVEAMYLQLPIFAFKVSYNRTTTENKAIYFESEDELEIHLHSIYQEKLTELSLEMKSIADRRYTWEKIARQYDILIKEAITIDLKPVVQAKVKKLNPMFLEELQLSHLKDQQSFYENR